MAEENARKGRRSHKKRRRTSRFAVPFLSISLVYAPHVPAGALGPQRKSTEPLLL